MKNENEFNVRNVLPLTWKKISEINQELLEDNKKNLTYKFNKHKEKSYWSAYIEISFNTDIIRHVNVYINADEEVQFFIDFDKYVIKKIETYYNKQEKLIQEKIIQEDFWSKTKKLNYAAKNVLAQFLDDERLLQEDIIRYRRGFLINFDTYFKSWEDTLFISPTELFEATKSLAFGLGLVINPDLSLTHI